MSVELMKAEMAVPVWKSALAIFYGGTAEEILFRLFLMTLLIWITLSVIYGWLYWKKGLESAMIAHFSTDIVLHMLIPHVIAPLLI